MLPFITIESLRQQKGKILHFSNKKNHGFTLIEIMIVIFIIGIAATFATLKLGNITHTRHIEETAKELSLLLPTAETQAIFQPAIIGIYFSANEYTFFKFVIDPQSQVAKWEPITRDRLLKKRRIAADVAITFINQASQTALLSASNSSFQPQLIFLPSGNISPFHILIGGKDEPARYRLVGNDNGEIKLIKLIQSK